MPSWAIVGATRGIGVSPLSKRSAHHGANSSFAKFEFVRQLVRDLLLRSITQDIETDLDLSPKTVQTRYSPSLGLKRPPARLMSLLHQIPIFMLLRQTPPVQASWKKLSLPSAKLRIKSLMFSFTKRFHWVRMRRSIRHRNCTLSPVLLSGPSLLITSKSRKRARTRARSCPIGQLPIAKTAQVSIADDQIAVPRQHVQCDVHCQCVSPVDSTR